MSKYYSAECADCGAVQFHNFVVINNIKAGIEYLHVSESIPGLFGEGHAMVRNALIGSRFSYDGRPECTALGMVLPFTSGLLVMIYCTIMQFSIKHICKKLFKLE